ncbi:biotin--[acetyl-CoA-carboxylase] ligase [Prochlorothrix hollandica]|uniref:BPL/LPL catalytic domain-containing protein n=1 Tax=Prochlorothrix hollandica PCC 9006 = CALU 1027 TaxID=317619 RepID=A0A0M2Q3H8_PROHO|nr:biotin--[acetyl-CoA-carboxylase] ligase [Prochlorothrix hollandica]KKJ01152.1 hypothetical protein PROH_01800 [Prochlorothrix hollandica PCC 9006 = CALU 1027]
MVWTTPLQDLPSSPWSGLPPFQMHQCDAIASTNSQLWHWLDQGYPHGTVLVARRQTAGRGQRGNVWQSETGGLYLSLGLRLGDLAQGGVPAQEAMRLHFGTAWGVREALGQAGVPGALKWPNDLVVAGRKLGGILLETRLRGGKIQTAVVGLGLNGSNGVPPTGISLAQVRQAQGLALESLEQVAAIVLGGLARGYDRWLNPHHSLDHLLPDYEQHLWHRGQAITVPIDGKPQIGRVVGVTTQGQLRVELADGVRCYQPGAVQLGYGSSQSRP